MTLYRFLWLSAYLSANCVLPIPLRPTITAILLPKLRLRSRLADNSLRSISCFLERSGTSYTLVALCFTIRLFSDRSQSRLDLTTHLEE
ncbi:hypothetical protein F5B19DRAFT_435150 [Rostrohypoxylon terebratum]|nr:hypothetical protein F5B19DRAFT_435150 [Rostrohypoxylon terebratum]